MPLASIPIDRLAVMRDCHGGAREARTLMLERGLLLPDIADLATAVECAAVMGLSEGLRPEHHPDGSRPLCCPGRTEQRLRIFGNRLSMNIRPTHSPYPSALDGCFAA